MRLTWRPETQLSAYCGAGSALWSSCRVDLATKRGAAIAPGCGCQRGGWPRSLAASASPSQKSDATLNVPFRPIRQARYSNMVPIPTRREHEGSLSVLAARAQHDEQLSQECSGEVLQAYIDDHTLCVTPKTAEEAFAKGRVSICDGARQRGDGELLLAAEDRTHRAHQTENKAEQTRLYRAVLQCDPPSFDDRTSALLGSSARWD